MSGNRARARLPGVRAPKPLLSREAERQLSARQLELLDELEERLRQGELAELTMAEIAARTGSSLRTLYGIAPSKDALLLIVVDRRLRRIGRAAFDAMEEDMAPLEALRAYLRAANEAVQPEAVALSTELAHVHGADRLLSDHENYLMAVAKRLLDRAVEAEEIADIDTTAVAHVLGGLGREFARPEVAANVRASARDSADSVTELILSGLRATR